MRRKYFGWAIAAVALLGSQGLSSQAVWAGDREIASQIIQRLKGNRDNGDLKDFTLDLKVNDGVVLFRGSVSADRHKDLVLAAADGIEGVAGVVDEMAIVAATPAVAGPGPAAVMTAAKDSAPVKAAASGFDMAGALATAAADIMAETSASESMDMPVVNYDEGQLIGGGFVTPVANLEETSDRQIVDEVLQTLGSAKRAGQLRGFGVDVQCESGHVRMIGKAASAGQRDQILQMVRSVPGVQNVQNEISVAGPAPIADQLALTNPAPIATPMPAPVTPAAMQSGGQSPYQTAQMRTQAGAQGYAGQQRIQGQAVGYNGQPVGYAAQPVMGAPVGGITGAPVPMAPYAQPGAPRYDTPNLPNYAWPGYAAHPNYAAVTYPQQYSPSAWPYIGPFYPYPQVPLGWRKVSLEWDDGWWFLDFTDRDY